jgi:hypothetical protein
MYESARETSKNESLADDNTTLTMMDLESLRTIKVILERFSTISGLCTNFEKSVIMPILEPTPGELIICEQLGFTVVNSFTLLGVEICANLDNIPVIFSKVRDKIVNLVNFWSRFKLTLPGRLTIMKTCLLSQLNYVGCFLEPPEEILSDIQQVVNNFVKGNLRVGKERISLPPKDGGLGVTNLKLFLQAQKCSWIMRADRDPIDNWRYDLRSLAPGNNILLIRECDVPVTLHPILHHLVRSYCSFYADFCKVGSNFKKAVIFDNPCFTIGADHSRHLDRQFFGNNFYQTHEIVIRSLTFDLCFMGNRVRSMAEFRDIGLPLSVNRWMTLQGSLLHAKRTLGMLADPDTPAVTISDFFSRIKKGSKKFRTITEHIVSNQHDNQTLRCVNTIARLTDTTLPVGSHLDNCLKLWYYSWLSNSVRDFIFKLRNNDLSLNNRLNSYDDTVDPRCNFCRILNSDTTSRDGLNHAFYDCPTTRSLLSTLIARCEPVPDINSRIFRQLYWYGTGITDEEDESYTPNSNIAGLVVFDIFRYTIWTFRCKRKVPNVISFFREFDFSIALMLRKSRWITEIVAANNMFSNFLQARG